MKQIQEDLIKSANQIRDKYRALKRGKVVEDEERLLHFQPLITSLEPLQALAKEDKTNNNKKDTSKQIVASNSNNKTPGVSNTPSRIPFLASIPVPRTLDFGLVAAQYLGNYLSKSNSTDTTYGIRPEDNKFFIGNKQVEIANDDITIEDKVYKGTKGLWELLKVKEPKDYSTTDLGTYKQILESTNGHLKGYKDNALISSNKHYKYINIIKPLFKITGGGIREVTGNKINYIYWDDPNELVSRLRLLWLSKEAGNSGVNNEIDSLIEELQECGIII